MMRSLATKLLAACILTLGIVSSPFDLYAIDTVPEGFKVNPSSGKEITAHAICRDVNNFNVTGLFVPTRIVSEWQSLISAEGRNEVPNVTLGLCGEAGSCDPDEGAGCETYNICDQIGYGNIQCDGSCDAVAPPDSDCGSCASDEGEYCYPENVCGDYSSGTIQCDGSCSVDAPPEPGSEQCEACNSCDQCNPGMTDSCGDGCSASAPSEGGCTPPPLAGCEIGLDCGDTAPNGDVCGLSDDCGCPEEHWSCTSDCPPGQSKDCADVCGGTAIDEGCGCGLPGPSGCDYECGSTKVDDGCGCGVSMPDGYGSACEPNDCGAGIMTCNGCEGVPYCPPSRDCGWALTWEEPGGECESGSPYPPMVPPTCDESSEGSTYLYEFCADGTPGGEEYTCECEP